MTNPRQLSARIGILELPTAISIIALAISALSLYYSRQSELRQLEQLVVSGSEDLSLSPDSKTYDVSKSFLITNISERVIAIQRVQFELKKAEGVQYATNAKIKIDNQDISYLDELNRLIKPGESVSIDVTFTPTMGKRAAEYLSKQSTGTNYENIAALCKSLGIDFYDNELNGAQIQFCPSFRHYKGKYNLQFMVPGGGNGDSFMLVARTYRDNAFASDRYQMEIGNSKM